MSAARRRAASGLTAALLGLPLLVACAPNTETSGTDAGDPRSLTVRSTDTECVLSATTAPAGNLRFAVTNAGGKVTEFYLYGSDGKKIVAEVENIGPGLSRDLVVTAVPGSYLTACKPGMAGEGIRAPFTVTASDEQPGASEADQQLLDRATQDYGAYVREQVEELEEKTEAFATAYVAGREAEARALYPRARVHWERIETVAESFGDLDPKMDAREADLSEGEAWTGWHRMEKDLWPARAKDYTPLTKAERKRYADDLVANTETLEQRVSTMTFTVDQIGNGSRALLDEVATGKVTGEEEYWSRTDLWDFQANVDGARVAFDGLRPLLKQKDPALDTQIQAEFTALQTLLDSHKRGDGFVSYDKLSQAEVKALSDAVNALSEPLSKLTAAVV